MLLLLLQIIADHQTIQYRISGINKIVGRWVLDGGLI